MTLKELRIQSGKTQKEMADLLGVSRSTYARFERDPGSMSIPQAKAVCQLLGCKIDALFH